MSTDAIWAELDLGIPGYVGHQVRAALAKHAGTTLPPEVFHYGSNGTTLPDAPKLRFTGSGKGIRIIGVGRDGALLLYRHAEAIARALDIGGRRWSLRDGAFSAQRSWPRTYRIAAFVEDVPTSLRAAAKAGTLDDPGLLAFVQERLAHALRRQCDVLGLPDPKATIALEAITKCVAVKIKAGRFACAFDLRALIAADLVGPWQLGGLQARGYGRVRKVRA